MAGLGDLFGSDEPVALVTGSGAPRVGNCIARTLAARGYRVAIHAHTSAAAARETADELQAMFQRPMLAVQGDLADEATVQRIIGEVAGEFGRLDVLVNSAAIWEPKPLEEVSAEDVRRHLEINSLSVFSCCQHAGLRMVDQAAGGVIINLGDWATVRPYTGYAAYFPSKGSIPTMTRMFAAELAGRNPRIRVNAVLPGPVMLPPSMPEAEREAAINATLVKREGSPQNVADAAMALIENDFITGVCLPVDGGRSVYAP